MAANVPISGNSILVDTPDSTAQNRTMQGTQLTSWLIARATTWESFRDRGYRRRWGEYWRMWRGMWSTEDRNRGSERSRLIAPALAQAIEMTVAEIEEGLFSKEVWFDIPDDIQDPDKQDAIAARDQLREDMDLTNFKDNVSEAVLVGAIFGTGLMKLNVDVVTEQRPTRDAVTKKLSATGEEKVVVTAESIRPDEFIPDPSGRTVQEMLGCFHRVQKPLHSVLEKIESGTYRADALPALSGTSVSLSNAYAVDRPQEPQATLTSGDSDTVEVLEYHGKVPLNLLNDAIAKRTPLDEVISQDIKQRPSNGDGPMVEAIVTIANNSVLLRAMINPFTMKDRSIVAFQFEKVPGRFWGRGVAEKGYNPQKALDAELRSRIDALGFISSPMMGIDSGRIPRGFKMEVKPGKVWLTQGPPRDVLQPVEIGNLNQATFGQTQEMERMVQMGTGAFDTASSRGSQQSQGKTGPTNTSLMMGAFVKRSKRAIRNVNDNLVTPLIVKSMWRYMQFAPTRYPQDYRFVVKPTLGIVAREVEAMQLTQLMGMLPQEFPQVNLAIARGILDLSAVHNKGEVMAAFEQALAPPSPEEQQRQKALNDMEYQSALADAQGSLLANQKTLAEIRKILEEANVLNRRADVEDDKVLQEQERIEIELGKLDQLREQNEIAMKRLDLQEQQLDAKIRGMNNTSE